MASINKDNYNPEENLLATLNDLDIGFVKVSNDGTILNHNLTFNKIFSYNREENLIGTKILDYWLNFEERNKFREILFKNGIVKKYIAPVKKVDGKEIFLELNFKLIKNSNGEIISTEGTFVELTERIRIEQELKESEERYKTILNGIVNGVWVSDKDDTINYTNKGMGIIAGMPSEQMINLKVLTDFPESTLHYFRPYYLKAKNTLKSVFYNSVPVETPAGRQSFQSGWLIPIEKEGKYDGIICTVEDVTERKKAEQKLKESEKKLSKFNLELEQKIEERTKELKESEEIYHSLSDQYKMLLESITDGVFVLDKNWDYVMINKTATEMVQMSVDQMIGNKLTVLFPGFEQTQFFKIYSDVMNKRKTKRVVGDLIHPDGRKGYYEVSVYPVTEGILCITRDITEKIISEQKLKESKEILRSTLESTADGILVVDEKGQISHTNSKFADMWRIPQDLIDKGDDQKLLDYVLSQLKDPEAFISKVEQLYRSTSESFDTLYFKDGRIFERFSSPLVIDAEIKGRVWSFRDITEAKKSEEALKDSERRLKEAQALGKIGYWEFDIISQQITWSDQVFEIYNRDPSLGPPSVEEEATYYTLDTNERLKEYSRLALEFGEEFDYDFEANLPNGMDVQLAALMRSIKNEEGQVIKLVGTVQDITERKIAEHDLKESEKKLKIIFENANDAISIHDLNGNFYTVNKTYCERLGYTREELLKLTPRDLNTPEYADLVSSRILEVREKGFSIFEAEHKTKDGRVIPVEISSRSIQYDDKPSILSIVRDITERKKAEDELNLFKSIIDASNEAIAISDLEGNLIYINPAHESLFGRSLEEAQKLNYRDFYPPESVEVLNNIVAPTVSKGESWEGVLDVYGVDGRFFPLWERADSVRDEEGNMLYGFGLMHDITERKEKEKEIFDLARFPSENPYPILRVNRNGIMYINDAGQKLLNVVDSDQIPEIFQESVKNSFESNQISESEVEIDNRVYSFAITPIKDTDYVNIYGMDITERKQVEENLKEVNKLKSEFLRRASHELKTPLISIKGFSDLILTMHREELNPDILSKLGEINQGCERLQNIINDLIHTSRLESSELKPKFEREDLTFLINYCVDELSAIATKREHSINIELPNSLIARFEKEEIHDVITNLLSNAIKYTPPKGWIDIKTETLDDFIVVSIKDNGVGFTEEQKDRIFQQFGKIERYGQGIDLGIDGSGLGLYISKKIVESHGGKIWMESEGKNKGSTFYFSLPK